MKQAIITIDLPEYEYIDTPVQYETSVGILLDENEIKNMKCFFDQLKACSFINELINSKEHYRKWFIKGMLRDYLYLDDREFYIIQNISHILQQHNKYSGLDFNDFKFTYQPSHIGKIIKAGNYEYKTELDLINVQIHNKKWEYVISEKV